MQMLELNVMLLLEYAVRSPTARFVCGLDVESCSFNKNVERSIFIQKHELQSEIVFKCQAIKVQRGIAGDSRKIDFTVTLPSIVLIGYRCLKKKKTIIHSERI